MKDVEDDEEIFRLQNIDVISKAIIMRKISQLDNSWTLIFNLQNRVEHRVFALKKIFQMRPNRPRRHLFVSQGMLIQKNNLMDADMNNLIWQNEPNVHQLRDAYEALVAKDSDAPRKLETLVARGSTMAAWYLASAYMKADYLEKNYPLSKEYFEKAHGLSQMHFFLHMSGVVDFESGKFSSAYTIFEDLAKRGYLPSMYRKGLMRGYGLGIEPDFVSGVKDIIEASRRGHINAIKQLLIFKLSFRLGFFCFLYSFKDVVDLVRAIGVVYFGKTSDGDDLDDRLVS